MKWIPGPGLFPPDPKIFFLANKNTLACKEHETE